MKIVVYGLTITSSWGNGHATTYRALLKALAARGHRVEFVEKDVEWYRSNRDMPEPEFCRVHLYEDWEASAGTLLGLSGDADVAVVGSYFPDAVSVVGGLKERGRCPVLFYDIDTPITLAALREQGGTEYLPAEMVREFAAYLSFTGGPALRELEERFGARRAVAFYCSVDAEMYRPGAEKAEFACDLSYLGTYAEDRQGKLMELLGGAAERLPERRFLVAGPQYPAGIGWGGNVGRMIHVSPREHPAFYSSSRWTLNLTRGEMVRAGWSPSVRLFEASACGAAILSDFWEGLDSFLRLGEEILIAGGVDEVVRALTGVGDEERRRMGARARERILAEHTAEHRAREFEGIVGSI